MDPVDKIYCQWSIVDALQVDDGDTHDLTASEMVEAIARYENAKRVELTVAELKSPFERFDMHLAARTRSGPRR